MWITRIAVSARFLRRSDGKRKQHTYSATVNFDWPQVGLWESQHGTINLSPIFWILISANAEEQTSILTAEILLRISESPSRQLDFRSDRTVFVSEIGALHDTSVQQPFGRKALLFCT